MAAAIVRDDAQKSKPHKRKGLRPTEWKGGVPKRRYSRAADAAIWKFSEIWSVFQ